MIYQHKPLFNAQILSYPLAAMPSPFLYVLDKVYSSISSGLIFVSVFNSSVNATKLFSSSVLC